jgi:putative phage-type endonuclease
MITLTLQQGTPEWQAERAKCFTASEAPAMLGYSKYVTRSQLLKQKATGFAEEVGSAKQRLFNQGHDAEAAARPLVEEMIGQELFPTTGMLDVEGLPLLASFDGLTMDDSIAWETKLFNEKLASAVSSRTLEPHYWAQIEQQLLVSGAEKCYFTTSDGTPERTVGMWYESEPARRAELIAGWKQFAQDLANYKPEAAEENAVAAPTMDLPSVSVQVSGSIALISNLDVFGARLTAFVEGINKKPANDQDFADAEAAIKTLEKAQGALEAAESGALAQTPTPPTPPAQPGGFQLENEK